MAFAIQHFIGGPRFDDQGRPSRQNWETVFIRSTRREASELCAALVKEGFVDGNDIQVIDLNPFPDSPPLPIRQTRTRQEVAELIWRSGEKTAPTNQFCPYCEKKVSIWDPAVVVSGWSLIHSECIDRLVIDACWLDSVRRKESSHGCNALQAPPGRSQASQTLSAAT